MACPSIYIYANEAMTLYFFFLFEYSPPLKKLNYPIFYMYMHAFIINMENVEELLEPSLLITYDPRE